MIPIAKPFINRSEADAASRAVLSGWVSQGPQVAAFEAEFANFVGAAHACAVSNCTTALHLALLGVGVSPGDEVITVSHSFIATANTIRQCGATPVFVDIERDGYNIDPAAIAAAMTPVTRAILVVHQMGMPCDMPAILKLAGAHGLPVIEDAACAAGSELRMRNAWLRIGRPLGDVVCFSFHPRKVITTGEGGMLTTNRVELDAGFRLARQHGMSVSDAVRHNSPQVVIESYPVTGFNYRMTDIQASIGREQLKRLPGIVSRRRTLAERYSTRLALLPGVSAPVEPRWARSNWQSYCVRLSDGIDQLDVMQAMLDRGVATRRGIMNAHQEAAYADIVTPPLPRSEAARDHSILLPLYAQMTDEEQDKVLSALEETLALVRRRGAQSA
ncbi:dTDP-4-amino-4,6-dideoxygalactose transaminase [Limimaricola variabilis]|uniref:dTDP-4-amino-4,6-dideoxygalactose transaminase n=1 Tax=Limimaricola variabilis TaxID=1492771 RepID=A0ABR6HJV2_9RHOB|nr:DegT/DnrJ/EryC1/StrS family aminotransferase [Limimaricola variabilis]MBB3710824.1 dTDP-4-amino-4,6-dideoxygalactose transaminase [Limimaricola variabilis]